MFPLVSGPPYPMSQFTVDISRFVKRAKAAPGIVIRRASLELMTSIVLKTPVDTGRARASWQASLNRVDPSVTYTLTDKDGAKTIVRGAAAINQWRDGDTIVLFSNLPYMPVLEYGRDDGRPGSKQAPQGMVRVSIAEWNTYIDKAVRSLPKD